jgi:TatD DNase family protein
MSEPSLFDSHCHLGYAELEQDPSAAWERATQAGVREAVVVAIDADSAPRILELVQAQRGLWAAVGIHPNETAQATEEHWARICELVQHPSVVAVGESGLDFYWERASEQVQRSWLDRHIELALSRDQPLVLHIRDAYPQAAAALESVSKELKGIVHCFAGAGDEADPFIEWGWPISFSGILTYGGAENVREAARRTPLAQCLVETDSPWLSPAAHRGKPNEPAFVAATARRLAEVKEVSFEQIAQITTANARRVFGLPQEPIDQPHA